MESTRFLWRRLEISFRLLVIIVPAYLVNVVVLAVTASPAIDARIVWTWAVLSAGVAGAWLLAAWLLRHPDTPQTVAVSSLSMPGFALTLTLLYSWFLNVSFPMASSIEQVMLAGFTIALLCLGSVTLANLPWAAGTWIAGLFLGVVTTLGSDVRWHTTGPWFMLATFFAVLVLVIVTYRRLFQERVSAETEAAHQRDMVGLLLHEFETDAHDWLWEADAMGKLKTASPRFADQWGRPPQELMGRGLIELLSEDASRLTVEDEEDLAALAAALAKGHPFRDLEVPVQNAQLHRRWRLSGRPVLDGVGVLAGWRGVGSDITEVQRLNNLNARLALLDNLTGLANRNRLQAVLHDHLSPRSGDRPCGLILLDLQGFRMVNEGLGHDVGDQVLRTVAQRLRPRVPTSALLARLGGDEFALLAPGAGDEALEGLVAALGSACDEPVLIDGHRLELTFQVGVALAPRDAQSAADLLKCAELALHQAKSGRSGLVVAYQAAFGDRARERLRLHAELKIALIEGQFQLVYQPQVRMSDGALVGCEALIRWKHPSRGMVSPAEFIPALEETGLIVPLGSWILETACREALTWPAEHVVAVNVSAVQFSSRTFLESVTGVLAATGFPASRLELEITESVMAQDHAHVVNLLRELRSLGVAIALDDFGTGYSSLSYLRQLPLDKLKVDQSFVRVMNQDRNAAAIVQTVLDLSRHLGLRTTAEGVEEADQEAVLRTMGCDSVQGYLYSRPLPPEALPSYRASLAPGSVPTRS